MAKNMGGLVLAADTKPSTTLRCRPFVLDSHQHPNIQVDEYAYKKSTDVFGSADCNESSRSERRPSP